MKNVVVKQVPENEVPTEILAEAICEISAAARTLLNGRLSRRAVIVLIQDAAKKHVTRGDVEVVLEAAADLERQYVRKK